MRRKPEADEANHKVQNAGASHLGEGVPRRTVSREVTKSHVNQITRGESFDNYTLHRPKRRGEPNPKAGHVTRETSGKLQKSRRTSGNLGEIKLQIEPDLILSKRRESGFSCDGHWTHGGSKAGERKEKTENTRILGKYVLEG